MNTKSLIVLIIFLVFSFSMVMAQTEEILKDSISIEKFEFVSGDKAPKDGYLHFTLSMKNINHKKGRVNIAMDVVQEQGKKLTCASAYKKDNKYYTLGDIECVNVVNDGIYLFRAEESGSYLDIGKTKENIDITPVEVSKVDTSKDMEVTIGFWREGCIGIPKTFWTNLPKYPMKGIDLGDANLIEKNSIEEYLSYNAKLLNKNVNSWKEHCKEGNDFIVSKTIKITSAQLKTYIGEKPPTQENIYTIPKNVVDLLTLAKIRSILPAECTISDTPVNEVYQITCQPKKTYTKYDSPVEITTAESLSSIKVSFEQFKDDERGLTDSNICRQYSDCAKSVIKIECEYDSNKRTDYLWAQKTDESAVYLGVQSGTDTVDNSPAILSFGQTKINCADNINYGTYSQYICKDITVSKDSTGTITVEITKPDACTKWSVGKHE